MKGVKDLCLCNILKRSNAKDYNRNYVAETDSLIHNMNRRTEAVLGV